MADSWRLVSKREKEIMLRLLSLRAAIILFSMLVLQGCIRTMMTGIYLDRKERAPVVVTEDAKAVKDCSFVSEIRSETAIGYVLDPNLSLSFVIAYATEKAFDDGANVFLIQEKTCNPFSETIKASVQGRALRCPAPLPPQTL
jgi:hypothetical protein